MLIDSHTHLYLDEFKDDNSGRFAVERALEVGVGRFMFPNVDLSTVGPMNELAGAFPGVIDMAIGLHPTEVRHDWRKAFDFIADEAQTGKYRAIGEVGIDYYWDKEYAEEQKDAFEAQCRLAVGLKLPVIIHCREGLEAVLEVFGRLNIIPKCVFHSFGGSEADVERIRDYGDFYFGINGIVTFKNSKLKEVLPVIGVDRILLETDSPYLAPVPLRGRRNESAYLVHTAAYVAQAFGMSLDEISETTTRNYLQFINE